MPLEPGRPRPSRSALLAVCLALAVPAAALAAEPVIMGAPAASAPRPFGAPVAPPPPTTPDRERELLDYRCANDLGVRQVTLFANGTVRVREGLGTSPQMTLGELGPDELAGYLRRLAAEDLSEVHDTRDSAEGSDIERCTLRLALDGRPVRVLQFSRFDSLPLQLAALIRVADEMAKHALPADQLPTRYKPRPGDVLRRTDGTLFEVVGFTADNQGVELQGVEQPLVLYLKPEELRGLFIELVSRREQP